MTIKIFSNNNNANKKYLDRNPNNFPNNYNNNRIKTKILNSE